MSRQNIYDDERFFLGYEQMRQDQAGFNETLERPALLSLLPDVHGATAIDLGCGDGALSRELVARGAAKVTGVDPSGRMLDLARQRTSNDRIIYVRAFAEEVEAKEASLDIVVSSLAMHYLSGEDFETVTVAVARWLRPGGTVIASMEHPMKTAAPNATGPHDSLTGYADEGHRSTQWFIDGVVKHHRTLETILGAFTRRGLTIRRVCEPMPSVAMLHDFPELAVHRRLPPILLVLAQRDPDVLPEERTTRWMECGR